MCYVALNWLTYTVSYNLSTVFTTEPVVIDALENKDAELVVSSSFLQCPHV